MLFDDLHSFQISIVYKSNLFYLSLPILSKQLGYFCHEMADSANVDLL